MIWFKKDLAAEDLRDLMRGGMAEYLQMEWLPPGEDYLQARMPVTDKVRQPYGWWHGGASCVLAETLGSAASAMVLDPALYQSAGLEINANHLRVVRDGFVTGTARPIHLGRSTHVWDIRLTDDMSRLICVSRLTVAILRKDPA